MKRSPNHRARIGLLGRTRRTLRDYYGIEMSDFDMAAVVDFPTPTLCIDVPREDADRVALELVGMGWSATGDELSDGKRRITAKFYGL